MPSTPRVFAGSRVLIHAADGPSPATIEVDLSGNITAVHAGKRPRTDFADVDYVDAGDLWILPGLVECVPNLILPRSHRPSHPSAHVHLNEPGRTEWEGFWTGTRAAASGGVTALVDMPLNSIPPTTTVAHLQTKRAAARGQCWVDVGFWGGVIPGNAGELRALVEAGVRGFKCFLIESGVEVRAATSLGRTRSDDRLCRSSHA
jgi:allantoinase